MKWTQSPAKTLFVLDVVLMVTFVAVMMPQATGIPLHEWLSFVFLIPFVVHLLFHWDWLRSVPPRLFAALRGEQRFNVVWDLLLYALMSFAVISGVLASESALPAIGIHFDVDPFWTNAHHRLSNLLCPLVGVHLAMHWPWIRKVGRQMFAKSDTVDSASQP